ncbi:MAG TPA: ATP-binding protein, partial [Actinoplanes sp.]|nr:ATP-binding protein [Actinoplanes sp.]
DLPLIRQLLDNLIGNAIKYTAPGVTPVLTIDADAGEEVTVRITDNGIGIPAGQHDKIFSDFHRAHADSGFAGTGLGLSICRRIVRRHGGTIGVTDNPDGGSCFTFHLPARV